MKKYSWLVVSVKDEWGRWAYPHQWHHNNNLTGLCADSKVETVNICDSKKEAIEIAEAWNEAYRKNGTARDFSKISA